MPLPVSVPVSARARNAGSAAEFAEVRLRLARRMMSLLAAWRRCALPRCRRARRCAGRDVPCLRAELSLPPPQEQARVMAAWHRALRRRRAEHEAAGDTGAKT